MSEITRDGIERALVEFTGFRQDQAVIDAFMVIFDAYAVRQAEHLAGGPIVAQDSYVHLLTQQAELLLDSAGRLAQAEQLAEQVAALAEKVTFLTGLTDGMQYRNIQLADKVAELVTEVAVIAEQVAEASRVTPDEPDIASAIDADQPELPLDTPVVIPEVIDPVSTETLREWLASDELADWERDLIERKLAEREAAGGFEGEMLGEDRSGVMLDEIMADIRADQSVTLPESKPEPKPKRKHDKGAGKTQHRHQRPRQQPAMPFEGPDGTMLLRCRGECGDVKPVGEFFKNAKSPSGYESKCRECRRASAA